MQDEKLARDPHLEQWVPILKGTPTPPRRRFLTPIQEGQVLAQVGAWLSKRVIQQVPTPPYVNNLVLAAKTSGGIRVCVDCTPCNKVMEDFDWPLPRLQDLRHFTRGKRWFAKFDLQDAFFRISVPTKYRYLTCFRCGPNTYVFTKMPFGLKTAPAHFQRFMDVGLSDLASEAWWYQDDILMAGETLSALRSAVRKVRARLGIMKCVINENKTVAECQSLIFAGLWVFGEGVGPNREKLSELLSLAPPRTKESAQSALGLVSYLRDFIPLVSHFTAELYPDRHGLRLSEVEFRKQWDRLMRHLREAATTTRHFLDGVDADLFTDASQTGLGVVLLQNGRVVALASRKLTGAETRYSATDREHLGLVYAVEKLKLFLHQSEAATMVHTDHEALLNRSIHELTPRQSRWATLVRAWMPKVGHVAGKINPADFISRWGLGDVGANL